MVRARAIVVGAGGISGAWFPRLKVENVEVVAVVDLRKEAAEGRIERHELQGTIASDDMAKTVNDFDADFVIDLTIPDAHCEVTCTALKAGKHVIGEKPMAATLEQCRQMVKTSEETGKLYMVSQSRRWDAKHIAVAQTIASGRLGRLGAMYCDFFLAPHFGGFRDQMDSPLVLDMAIHTFDQARMFIDGDPVAVYCEEFNPVGSWYRGDASANALFEMQEGVRFAYRGSWCAEGHHTSWNGNWRFIGERGTMLYEQDQPPHGATVTYEEGFGGQRAPFDVVPSRLDAGGQHGALREFLHFLDTGQTPQCECHDNIKSMAMVFAAVESSATGQRVPVRW